MKREEEIFEQAIALASPEARERYLLGACGDDRDLRRRVDELLGAFQDAGQIAFLQTGDRSNVTPTLPAAPLAEGPGTRIGRYKLLQQIGEGGFGVVFMAEQEEPVRRKVAFKIIKLGMDTKQVIARFQAERQALALMDHPNIAKVLDAGATDGPLTPSLSPADRAGEGAPRAGEEQSHTSAAAQSQIANRKSQIAAGRPYFVMELIKGVPITQFCDKNKLPTQDRLKLFIAVCQAIQHAHQKGIIHRDIKPSNILVTLEHGEPMPKVIDFGIAKAIDQQLTEKTLFTNYGQMIGTPAYMSPEQLELSSLDIDTRTDIYSLGVLFYELLTGTTPIPEKRLRSAGYAEMQRLIREEEPERPSTRLTNTLVAADLSRRSSQLPNVDASPDSGQRLQLQKLIGLLKGDLDWIVMKALEKDRRRRYDTPNELVADVQRYLRDEPILAKPPSQLYRLKKMVRRNKLAFAAAIAVAASLVLGIAATAWQAVKATRAVKDALASKDKAEQARKAAQQAQANEAELRQKAEAESYTADMNVVLQAWEEGNLKRAQDLLRAHIPKAGERDLRGFEWRYLWKLCQDESRLAFTNFPEAVSLALSDDAKVVAACSGHAMKLLDLVGGRELDALTDPEDIITTAAFSPTGTSVLATGTDHGTIKLWNLTTRELLGTLCGHTNSIHSLGFSTDGTLLACISDNALTLWDVEARTTLWARTTSWWAGDALAFAPDGKSLVTGGGELGNPILWDVATANSLPFPAEQKGWVGCIAFSPDGKTLATGGTDSTIILWDFATRTRRGTLVGHRGPVEAVRFSPDGRYLVSGSVDATLRLWDVASQQETALLRGHQGTVFSAVFARDARSLISSSGDHTIRVWDTEPKRAVITLQGHKPWPNSPLFSPDGQRFISVDLNDGFTRVWDVASHRSISTRDLLAELPPTERPVGAAFSPNGEWLAVGSSDHTVRLWNAKTLELRHVLTNDYEAGALSFSPDSRVLAVARFGLPFAKANVSKALAFWSLDSFQKIKKLEAAAPHAARVAFAHHGALIAVGYSDGTVRLWDFSTETLVKEFKQHSDLVFHLAFSSDDTLLASCSGDAVVLYDVRGGRAFPPLKDHAGKVTSVAFAPDDKTLASTSFDGTVKLWNLATRQAALTLIEHTGPVTQATFAPDGKLLAATGADGTVRLWPAPSLQEIQNIEPARPPQH